MTVNSYFPKFTDTGTSTNSASFLCKKQRESLLLQPEGFYNYLEKQISFLSGSVVWGVW